MMKRIKLDAAMLAATAALYAGNRMFFSGISGAPGQFCRFYGNDILAGIFILALLNILLFFSRYPPVRNLLFFIPFLLFCGFVWEFLAPLWKPGAVTDFWDLLAYQAGGVFYWLCGLLFFRKRKTSAV